MALCSSGCVDCVTAKNNEVITYVTCTTWTGNHCVGCLRTWMVAGAVSGHNRWNDDDYTFDDNRKLELQ